VYVGESNPFLAPVDCRQLLSRDCLLDLIGVKVVDDVLKLLLAQVLVRELARLGLRLVCHRIVIVLAVDLGDRAHTDLRHVEGSHI